MKRKNTLTALIIFLSFFSAISLASENLVYFNQAKLKVHKMTCHWGQVCTKNCVIIPRSEAYKRGGVACKVCGG